MSLYVVRGVPSADILQVCEPKDADTLPLASCKKIGLSALQVPKVGRRTPNEIVHDDEWGFEAREFVRKTCIGKTIKFVKEAYVEQLERDMGEVMYKEGEKRLSLNVELARSGLADVSERAAAKNTDLASRIAEGQMEAVTEKKGIYSGAKPRNRAIVNWDASQDEVDLLAKTFDGKKVQGIVEAVFGGHMLKVCIPPTEGWPAYTYCSVQMTGILCDKKPGTVDPKVTPADQELFDRMHNEAKTFTERNLAFRDVTLLVEGTKFDSLLCSIVSGPKVFQEVLLKKGYAKSFDGPQGTMGKSKEYRTRLREAEQEAQTNKAGRWANLQETKRVVGGDGKEEKKTETIQVAADFEGVLLQLISPDLLIVLNEKTGEEVKVGLANVRGGGSTDLEIKKDEAGRPPSNFARMERADEALIYKNFFLEGRNFVADKCIGKKVQVLVDYMSQVNVGRVEDLEEKDKKTENRINASVYYTTADGKRHNIGTDLIRAGFAVPIGSRDRVARDIDDYGDAFLEAKEARRGLHNPKNKGEHRVQDFQSKPGEKAGKALENKGRGMLAMLQRSGVGTTGVPRLPAFVEYVLGPARVKVFIPRDNCQIAVNLAGLAAPQMPLPNTDDAPDSCAAEALLFSKRHLLQRNIELQVEHFGKGTFVGNVFLNGENFANKLLEAGMATMEQQNTSSMVGKESAEEAQRRAKEAKVGIWAPGNSLPKRVHERMAQNEKYLLGRQQFLIGTPTDRVSAIVTEVVDGSTFYFHPQDKESELQKVQSLLHSLSLDAKSPPDSVKFDEVVAAKFSADNKWYRAKVTRVDGKKVGVLYVDFGNRETVDISKIRRDPKVNIRDIPVVAEEAHIAFLYKLPSDEVGARESTAAVGDFVEGRTVTVAHEYTHSRRKYYTVRFGEKPLQADLVKRGLALVALNVENVDQLKKPVSILSNLEAAAKQNRIGIWSQLRGDPRNEDEEM